MKHLNKSRVAFLVCLLVLAMALTAVLALNVFAEDEEIVTEFTGYTVVVTDSTDLVIQGTISLDDDLYSEMQISYSTATQTFEPVDLESDESGETFSFYLPVGLGQMGDVYTVNLIKDGEIIDTKEVSVKGYFKTILDDSYIVPAEEGEEEPTENPAELKLLVSELARYGAAALDYLAEHGNGINEDGWVDDDADSEAFLEGLTLVAGNTFPTEPAYTYEIIKRHEDGATTVRVGYDDDENPITVPLVNVTAIQLVLNSSMDFIIKTDADLDLVAGGTYVGLNEDGTVTVEGVPLKSFFDYSTFSVYTPVSGSQDGFLASNSVRISPSMYAAKMAADADEADLVKALYNAAFAAHSYVGHSYEEEIVTAANCQHDGVSHFNCVCGVYREETMPKNDTHSHITPFNKSGKTIGYACTDCGETWATVDKTYIFDGTSHESNGLSMRGIETAFNGVDMLPPIVEGEYVWTRADAATAKNQHQIWYDLPTGSSGKNQAKFIFSVDVEYVGSLFNPEGRKQVLGYYYVNEDGRADGSWGKTHSMGTFISFYDDGTIEGFNETLLGNVNDEGYTNVTAIVTFGEETVDGKVINMMYVTYYVDGEGICTISKENTLKNLELKNIYHSGYVYDNNTGIKFDNLQFGWTNGNAEIVEVSDCGNIEYKLPGSDDVISTNTHAYAETITKEPSCTSTGTKEMVCTCGASQSSVTIPMTPHAYDFANVVAADTSVVYECADCEKTFTYDAIGVESFTDDVWNKTFVTGFTLNNAVDTTVVPANGAFTFIPTEATNHNSHLSLYPSTVKDSVTDAKHIVIGFDISMPEGGFPAGEGAMVAGKINGKWLTKNLVAFKNAGIYAFDGTKLVDVTANTWYNIVLDATLTTSESETAGNTVVTVGVDVYVNGMLVKKCSWAEDQAFTGEIGWTTAATNTYFQFLLSRAGHKPETGWSVDNILLANSLPDSFASHVCEASEYIDNEDGTHTIKCSCGAEMGKADCEFVYATTTPATCVAEGVSTGTCVCGATKTQPIAKVAHKITGTVDADAKTISYTCSGVNCTLAFTNAYNVADTFDEGYALGSNNAMAVGSYCNGNMFTPVFEDGVAKCLGPMWNKLENNVHVDGTCNNNVYYQFDPYKANLASPTKYAFGFDLTMPEGGFPTSGIGLNFKPGAWGKGSDILKFKDGKAYADVATEIATFNAGDTYNFVVECTLDIANKTHSYVILVNGEEVHTFTRTESNAIPEAGFAATSNVYFQLNVGTAGEGNKNDAANAGFIVDNLFAGNPRPCMHEVIVLDATSTIVDEHGDGHADIAGNLVYKCADCGFTYTLPAKTVCTFTGGHVCENFGATFANATNTPNMTATYENDELKLSGNMADCANNHDITLNFKSFVGTLADPSKIVVGFDIAIPEGCTNFGGGLEFPFKFGAISGSSNWVPGVELKVDASGKLLLGGNTEIGQLVAGAPKTNIVMAFSVAVNATDDTKIDFTTEIWVNGVYAGASVHQCKNGVDLTFIQDNCYMNIKIGNNDANKTGTGTLVLDNLFIGENIGTLVRPDAE